MNNLYISDLDGTLLNNNADISDKSVNIINSLIENGMNFSIATARTAATVKKILEKINFKLPVILMNGAALYDFAKSEYINIENINSKKILFDIINKYKKFGFLYTIENNQLYTYYKEINTSHAKKFMQERINKYGKIFTKVRDFYDCADENIIYYSVSDTKENLINMYLELSQFKTFNIEFYQDIYCKDLWYMEVCSAFASKYNAVLKLKNLYNFNKLICFGDNFNDLPMFEICDESYAVENANKKVKEKANDVIKSNNNDGVSTWLLENYHK